ncbi:MAG: acetolactate synthase small subunit [Haloferacaceae archaeon]
MSGLDGPAPDERAQPDGRRTADGRRVGDADGDDGRRAVLSALVENQPGVLAAVTGLFARRQVNIERIVGEPVGDGERSRITFVVVPPHPGVERVTRQLERLRPVVSVAERDAGVAERLTASLDDG